MINNFVKKLENVLNELNNEGIHGTRNFISISSDYENRYCKDVQILRNDSFELVFNKKENEVQLFTTYSNQLIDDEFIHQLKLINDQKGAINTFLQTIFSLQKAN